MTIAADAERLRLFPVDGLWEVTRRTDPVLCRLADRHYPRRRRGYHQVGPPAALVCLRATADDAGWISAYSKHPDDGLDAWRCTMFRNEGDVLSSALILDAMRITAARWGEPPADGWLTYVDTRCTSSPNPGYCFLAAGWWRDRTYKPGRRRRYLIRLRHD